MELAPKPKAVTMLASLKMKYMTTTPRRPTPTTVIPMTLPPGEGYFERVVHCRWVACGEGGFTVGFGGDSHSDVAGEGAAYGSADEADGALRVYFPCEERSDYDLRMGPGLCILCKGRAMASSLDDSGTARSLARGLPLNAPILPDATAAYPSASAPTTPVNNSIFIAELPP